MTKPAAMIGERYRRALVDAAQWHEQQVRKGTNISYVSHLLAVSAGVMEDGGDEDECIAALLHDAVEDCNISRKTIADRFGERVAAIVMACTDDAGGDAVHKAPWWPRKVHHIEHISRFAANGDLGVIRVTAADKLSNLRSTLDDPQDSVFSIFKAGLGGFLWYHETFCRVLVDALRDAPASADTSGSTRPSILAVRLDRALGELGALTDRYRERYAPAIAEMLGELPGDPAVAPLGGHDPLPWFVLDVAHRARGDAAWREHLPAARAGWFAQPL
jgi:hypothetical protein